jgi:Fe-Mn family superoxide dismutase
MNPKDLELKLNQAVDKALKPHVLKEAYVTVPKKIKLTTEKLSEKIKRSMLERFENSVNSLNKISANLDGANLEAADNSISSNFRNLKISESYAINESFLQAEFLENISDMNSSISMDMLCYMRLARDFGDFDTWQKNFIACAKSSRNGYAVTAYSIYLKRYINFVIDSADLGVPVACIPVIVLDVNKGCYVRDYVDDLESYIKNMMREFNWQEIENRFVKAEKVSRVFG